MDGLHPFPVTDPFSLDKDFPSLRSISFVTIWCPLDLIPILWLQDLQEIKGETYSRLKEGLEGQVI